MPTENNIVTITGLQEITGETARQLQYWSDLGAVRPLRRTNKRGRGIQRMFQADPPTRDERVWALVASEMNRWRLPIGIVTDLIDRMRELWTGPETAPSKGNPIACALRGEQVLILIALRDDEPPLVGRLDVERSHEPPTVDATFEKGFLGPDQTEDWQLFSKRAVMVSDEFLADFSSAHLLNLTRVLRPLASRASIRPRNSVATGRRAPCP
jgi:hypothetical protein